eukprot:4802622-Pleurochrysis_carterae.AAC.1
MSIPIELVRQNITLQQRIKELLQTLVVDPKPTNKRAVGKNAWRPRISNDSSDAMMMKMRVDGVKVLYQMGASILIGESDTDMAELSGETIREYIAMCYELVASAAASGEQLGRNTSGGRQAEYSGQWQQER